MKGFKYTILFVSLFSYVLVMASDREIPSVFSKNWSPKSVVFGVNQAWDYIPQEKTVLTFYGREKYRPFNLDDFPTEKYKEYLTNLRNLGLKFIGISAWNIQEIVVEKIDNEKILVKVQGTYQKETGLVQFTEWQLFDGYLYSQVNLIEDVKAKHIVMAEEKEKIFKEILKL